MKPFERALRLLLAIQRGEPVSAAWMVERFAISRSQAKRDMLELERVLPVLRVRQGESHRAVIVPLPQAQALGWAR